MASTGIISGNANGLRTSEVCNPFHYVLTLDLCNNASNHPSKPVRSAS
ncbi:MAG: hypothetical protein E5299_00568 [Burkholderia gladioli]|nr:MAG: hypothetical protein E5299_00568 [Burkholderia gladioli]